MNRAQRQVELQHDHRDVDVPRRKCFSQRVSPIECLRVRPRTNRIISRSCNRLRTGKVAYFERIPGFPGRAARFSISNQQVDLGWTLSHSVITALLLQHGDHKVSSVRHVGVLKEGRTKRPSYPMSTGTVVWLAVCNSPLDKIYLSASLSSLGHTF